jgi:predicted RNA-binding Zn-ribbon protein involved in translation (DUF1610 family)
MADAALTVRRSRSDDFTVYVAMVLEAMGRMSQWVREEAMQERRIAAHAYQQKNGFVFFHLPCCDKNVNVPMDQSKFGCPYCGKGYERGVIGEIESKETKP